MNAGLEQVRDQQRDSWNKFSPGWRKWDHFTMKFLEPMGTEIIERLKLKKNDKVLDLASGTGEPGLTIAEIVSDGNVTITDLAAGMLEVAIDNAAKRNIVNIETLVCDVSALPFNDASFEAISCRQGFMFFPDMQLAANEMFRVLKPGGRLSTSVWNVPAKNFWVTAMMSALNNHLSLPQPSPGAPSMFRCADENLIADILKQSGFKNITVKEVSGKLVCESPEFFWDFHGEVSAPVVGALGKTDEKIKNKIKAEVFATLNSTYPDGNIRMDSSTLVISGEK